MISTVLFDLDGTLLDTAPDLGYALNRLLVEDGREPLDDTTIRPWASHGARGLLQLGYDAEPDSEEFLALRIRFLEHYAANLARATRPFEGMNESLSELAALGLRWGIVTNKPAAYTEPLVEQISWPSAPVCVISGDSAEKPKPDPAPLFLACEQSAISPSECVYVGDAERDMQAADAAGMPGLAALWGYIQDHERPETWQAEALLDTPLEIPEWLKSRI